LMFPKVLEEPDASVLSVEESFSCATWRYIPEDTDPLSCADIFKITYGRPLLCFRELLILSHPGP
jgi:hypothetical protein